jgi:TDG/mug DNA glycosylase family protein
MTAPAGGVVPDLIAPGLRVLFCGINPGLRSAELAQHFARPGNRFWKLLHAAGFTDRLLAPGEQDQLLALGIGITNLVHRPSASAAELSAPDLRDGGRHLEEKVAAWRPRHVAVLGVQAFRTAFRRPKATVGRQAGGLGPAALWALPNPSGLQASYQLAEMTVLYRELALAAGFPPATAGGNT